MIDFSPLYRGEKRLADLAADVQHQDLIDTTNAQLDSFVEVVRDLSDAQVVFIATDPSAEGEIGWNVAHVIAHMTATGEENAAVSSILARGIAYSWEPRLRTEVEWTTLTTTAACLQRLEESRRIQLGYLQAWPDQPSLDVFRSLPEAFAAQVGPVNAPTSILLGLAHGNMHTIQIQDIAAQARAASAES